jgi:hypothetical protein
VSESYGPIKLTQEQWNQVGRPEPAAAPMVGDETDDARNPVDLLRELESCAYERGKLDAMIQLARDPDVTVRLADKGNALETDIRVAEQRILRRFRAADSTSRSGMVWIPQDDARSISSVLFVARAASPPDRAKNFTPIIDRLDEAIAAAEKETIDGD